jgi:hypothetical protein
VADIPAAVGRYAQRVHAAIRPEHHVASPLGAWLVLALSSSAVGDGELPTDLVDALGVPPDEARAAARDLLAASNRDLHLAAAAWYGDESPALFEWLATLGTAVETGPVPAQTDADRWADEHTLGLIKQFPLEVDASAAIMLATAVACSIDWQSEFDTSPATELVLPPAGQFAGLTQVLHSPHAAAIECIADTDDGPVAVHAMPSARGDMRVVSVIADPDLPHGVVLAHAHRIAVAVGRGDPLPRQVSLFDLPLGVGHSWLLSERREPGAHDDERFDIVLPAWSARSEHNLMSLPHSGFVGAAHVLARLVGGVTAGARQVALARYTRTGFEAAAVTGVMMRSAAVIRRADVTIRSARVEFTHPFAVVAVGAGRGSPWAGVPLFSAWVARADEPWDPPPRRPA